MHPGKIKFYIIFSLCTLFIFYSLYLYSFLPYDSTTISKECSSGKLIWQKYNCNACHQIYGLGGYLGPDLTNEYSKRGPIYINAFLKTGTSIMPDFKLTEMEIKALSVYLQNIDSSGKSDPRTYTIGYDGTIQQ